MTFSTDPFLAFCIYPSSCQLAATKKGDRSISVRTELALLRRVQRAVLERRVV